MVFQMIRGKAIHHVARTFAQNVNNAAASEQFLLIPEIEAPFISLGTILTSNLVTQFILFSKIKQKRHLVFRFFIFFSARL